jgi:hypothetical protein
MKEHHLKTHPEPFAALADGRRTFEYRADDGRGFEVGDVLVLEEWIPNAIADGVTWPGKYTGRELRRRVTYLLHGPDFGVPEGYVVMGLAPVLPTDAEIMAKAVEVFGSADDAVDWWQREASRLGYEQPSLVVRTAESRQRVWDLLIRFEHGVYT